MSNIKQKILAKKWAEKVLNLVDNEEAYGEDVAAAANFLSDAIDLRSLQHFLIPRLSGVTSVTGEEMVTISNIDRDWVICYRPDKDDYVNVRKEDLFPNGKRHKIVEDGATVSQDEKVEGDQQGHSKILTSLSEYSNAPSGTIVFASDSLPLVKMRNGDWATGVSQYPVTNIAGISRKMARWGWKL